jgi:hypothetical protein
VSATRRLAPGVASKRAAQAYPPGPRMTRTSGATALLDEGVADSLAARGGSGTTGWTRRSPSPERGSLPWWQVVYIYIIYIYIYYIYIYLYLYDIYI